MGPVRASRGGCAPAASSIARCFYTCRHFCELVWGCGLHLSCSACVFRASNARAHFASVHDACGCSKTILVPLSPLVLQVVCLDRLEGHGGSVWDVAAVPALHGSDAEALHAQRLLATCASDGVIRLWGLQEEHDSGLPEGASRVGDVRVACSLVGALAARPSDGLQAEPAAGVPVKASEAAVVLRCLAVSPDGAYLAAGDQHGSVRVYSLVSMALEAFVEAHDGDVLSLHYSPALDEGEHGRRAGRLLASGGMDGLIHVFQVSGLAALLPWAAWREGQTAGQLEGVLLLPIQPRVPCSATQQKDCPWLLCLFSPNAWPRTTPLQAGAGGIQLLETLDDHSGAVTCLRFAAGGKCLISCSADRAVVFR